MFCSKEFHIEKKNVNGGGDNIDGHCALLTLYKGLHGACHWLGFATSPVFENIFTLINFLFATNFWVFWMWNPNDIFSVHFIGVWTTCLLDKISSDILKHKDGNLLIKIYSFTLAFRYFQFFHFSFQLVSILHFSFEILSIQLCDDWPPGKSLPPLKNFLQGSAGTSPQEKFNIVGDVVLWNPQSTIHNVDVAT